MLQYIVDDVRYRQGEEDAACGCAQQCISHGVKQHADVGGDEAEDKENENRRGEQESSVCLSHEGKIGQ